MVLPLARALTKKELYNSVEENDEKHRMIGIFAKNSLEWMLCDLAGAMSSITSVTLYDTLGPQSTQYIINQCELKTICLTNDKIKGILDLVKAEKLTTLKNFILLNEVSDEEVKMCEEAGVAVHMIYDLIEEGKNFEVKMPNPHRDSIYTICYTSGTTGDPKGVMLSHINLICPGAALLKIKIDLSSDDVHLSYLPLAHVLERIV